MAIISPDLRSQIDGSVQKNILAHLPEFPAGIVPISWFPDFVFKEPIVGRYVLIDFMESHSANEEYEKFWNWVLRHPPILTFRRELLKRDVSPVVKPIEWPCYLPQPSQSERATFDSRPIEVLYFWGYSNQLRPKLHADIFNEGMAKNGLNVIDNWEVVTPSWLTDCMYPHCHRWLTVHTPHWRRKPMVEILPIMEKSKISVAMPGNGFKTFRDTECIGTILAIQKSDIAYSYQWNQSNSIQIEPGNEFQSLLDATRRTDLYDLYVACTANMRNYESHKYVNDYVADEIRKVL